MESMLKTVLALTCSKHAGRLDRGRETERTMFFSDAVFAIAMTLLALDLRLSDLPADITVRGFESVLVDRVPALAAFALSFVLVGWTWINHHRRFNAIVSYDNRLQVINLLILFFVVFLPGPTTILFADVPSTP
ncbi:TMEM175 family protein [Arthrobacter alpinus]|uniref:TMEM175 family protein n=1 Tax=Arthrobacter alpinus TaxID=656366 RepID=UPI0016493A9C|nr:TMEM175 family protein [Arthrobacter alpinus]